MQATNISETCLWLFASPSAAEAWDTFYFPPETLSCNLIDSNMELMQGKRLLTCMGHSLGLCLPGN